jgi:hypothetical protein
VGVTETDGVMVGVTDGVGVNVGVTETEGVIDGVIDGVGVNVGVTETEGVIDGVIDGVGVGEDSIGDIVTQNVQSAAFIIKSKPQVKSQLIFFLTSQPVLSIILTMMIGAVANILGRVR